MTPAWDVGGDFYDFYLDGDRLWFCIADVSGKGVPAALVMAITVSHFRTDARLYDSPEEVVTALNDGMAGSNAQNMFVTMFVGMLDLMDGDEGWMLMKGNCELGDAAVMSINKETGIMYIAGSKGPDPVAISPEGNILWRAEINDPEVSGPKKISLKKDNIKVTYKSGKTVLLEYSGELISISDSV